MLKLLTIFSSLLARSSSIFWNGVLLACCSCNFSCSFLFRFRFSIARSNSDFVFRTSMPLEYNNNKLLDYRNFQRLKYLLSVQLLVNKYIWHYFSTLIWPTMYYSLHSFITIFWCFEINNVYII